MYEIIFYKDDKGDQETYEYIAGLKDRSETIKDSRIKFNKIIEYIDLLAEHGMMLGEKYVKHLTGELWELRPLRPLRDRILFAFITGNKIIILHHFMKTTQKTPKKEIEKALNNLKKYKEG